MTGIRVRTITLDGAAYGFVIRRADLTHVTVRAWSAGSRRGRVLDVLVPFHQPWLEIPSPYDPPVTPALVASVIRAAVRRGWRPSDGGAPMRFMLDRARGTLAPA